MTFLPSLDGLPPAALLAAACALLALLAWLGWRKPTWLFLLAFASLAIRPQLLWGGSAIGWEWGLHQTLIVFALVVNALHYGVRRTVNWPILALVTVFILSIAFGNLHPKLTFGLMLQSLATLALPFAFTQVVLEPGSRRLFALAIMLLPLLSVALGGLLQLLGLYEVFSYARWVGNWYRLPGAIGDAATFATLAFTGFVVALHEATRRGRPYAVTLAVVNLILVLFSGTRMAIFASICFAGIYTVLSADCRKLYRRQRRALLIGAGAVIIALVEYLPTLMWRTFDPDFSAVQISGRDVGWSFFLQEWLGSPVLGRGFGAGFIAARDWLDWTLPAPHNEYIHLLVSGGLVGFALVAGGIFMWYRQLLRRASENDRSFLLALAPTLAVYAITDNIWFYWTALPLYAYLGVLLTRPSLLLVPRSAQPGILASRDDLLGDFGR